MGRGGAGKAGRKGGRLARGGVELALFGVALLALIFIFAAKFLAPPPPPPQGVFPETGELRLCVNQTGTAEFYVNVKGYRTMYVSVTGGADGLSVSYPLPSPPQPFNVTVKALTPGNYTLSVKVTLIGKGVETKTFVLRVAVKDCATSS